MFNRRKIKELESMLEECVSLMARLVHAVAVLEGRVDNLTPHLQKPRQADIIVLNPDAIQGAASEIARGMNLS